jgi:isopentenyldiphosphate isomerase
MENIDLVNLNDEVIGITDKVTAHRLGQIHRVAAVYVFDRQRRLLVQEHKFDGRLDHSVGGHVKSGETYEAAADREAKEELNLNSDLLRIGTFYLDETARGNNFKHMFGLFTAQTPENWSFHPTVDVKVLIPMTIEEITQQMQKDPMRFTLGFIGSMKEYLKIIQNN